MNKIERQAADCELTRKVVSAQRVIDQAVRGKRACVMCSFGKDSLVVLALTRVMGLELEVVFHRWPFAGGVFAGDRGHDRLVLDTGPVDLLPSAFLYTDAATGEDTAYTHRSGIVFDKEMIWLGYTRAPRFRMLENKGGGPRGIYDVIFIVGCDNPVPIVTVVCNS